MKSIQYFVSSLSILVLLTLSTGCASSPAGRVFSSPDDAADALVKATQPWQPDELRAILGPDAQSLIYSGDSVVDENQRQAFLAAFHKKREVVQVDDNTATLLVGDDQWPFPVPIVRSSKGWSFDTAQGVEEVVARRVGRNELSTIQVCLAIVEAQYDYRSINPEGNGAYASRFLSEPGKKNGLYWPAEANQPASPLGELVAVAATEGYKSPTESPNQQPYHGYFYRILTSQGPSALGGAQNYLVDGKLKRGFAIISWPAEYGKSGIMTFIVSQYGVVYQQDFGKQTATRAAALNEFEPNPDKGWIVSED